MTRRGRRLPRPVAETGETHDGIGRGERECGQRSASQPVELVRAECPSDALCDDSKMVSVVRCNIRKCALLHATEAMTHILSSATTSGCSSQIDYVLLQECSSWAGCHIQLGSSSLQVYGSKDNHTPIAVRDQARAILQEWGTSCQDLDRIICERLPPRLWIRCG